MTESRAIWCSDMAMCNGEVVKASEEGKDCRLARTECGVKVYG